MVAHMHHGLRAEAEEEADRVRRLAGALEIPFELGREDVLAFSASHRLSLEEAARIVRYRFLFEQAERYGAQAVAVGHNADDQVETVLMHLLRGAGLEGLKGMAYRSLPHTWSDSIPLVRPLLGVWREQVLAYTVEHGLLPAMDPSNLDTRFYRNRLRHELIPYLESYNPNVRQAIWRSADVLREDYRVLESMVDTVWQAGLRSQGHGFVAFDLESLQAQPPGTQRHILRRAIACLRPGLRDIDFEDLEQARGFMTSPSRSGQRDLVSGLRIFVEQEQVWLAAWEADLPVNDWPQLPESAELSLGIPGALDLPGGWRLTAQFVPDALVWREQALANADPFQAWIDSNSLQPPLQVRSRRPGDRLQPLGLKGHSMKLSDFMINVKLPHRARDGWPLVVSEGQIVWVPGFRLAHSCRVTDQTQSTVHMQLSRGHGD